MNKRKSDTRIFLVRHGQPKQHSGKIFLGQADVPLSDLGKEEALAAANRLVKLDANPKHIYTSDLARAKETAEIVAGKFGVPVVPDKLFREMAMGSWDGELIEDIKNKFPGEYEKRGDDPRNYRTPGGENFYDLHGRVLREFHRIFSEDFRGFQRGKFRGEGSPNCVSSIQDDATFEVDEPGDLIIVAHLGVIVALTEELLSTASDNKAGRFFPTGSVTEIDAPDWLWPEREES